MRGSVCHETLTLALTLTLTLTPTLTLTLALTLNPNPNPDPNPNPNQVCHETDDERGRRVRYGAHAMIAADPWSACNPNFSMGDSRVTRGADRRPITGAKRPNPGSIGRNGLVRQ